MLTDLFLRSMIHSALGVRPKPYFGAGRFFGGGMPGLGLGMNLSTLIGAAGVAWGAYEHLKNREASVMTTVEGGGFSAASAPPSMSTMSPMKPMSPMTPLSPMSPGSPATSGAPPPLPPPLPGPLPASATGVAASDYAFPTGPDALRRLVALTIAAARADGDLGEEEYGKILAAAREHGAADLVQGELQERRTIQEIVAGASDPRFRADLYALAFGIVRADGSVSPAERKWLRELAAALSLDTEAAARIEQETADGIDRHAQ